MSKFSDKNKFLDEINGKLPKNINWKKGAIEYLDNLFNSSLGKGNELYHYVKPFVGGPDFSSFFNEMYGFLNVLQKLDLKMNATILDVGCGPGWTSHFLSKLGYRVHGIDISQKCVDIATERIATEPYTAYENTPLDAEFFVHDIEESVFDLGVKYDVAFFDSTLHHFYNPIAVLDNVSSTLSQDGLICCWEACAEESEESFTVEQIDIMNKYNTLERPYTRSQMERLLKITGFNYYEFYSQVNGFFNMSKESDLNKINFQLDSGNYWNIFIASKSDSFFCEFK